MSPAPRLLTAFLIVASGTAYAQTQVLTIDEIQATSNLSFDATGNYLLPITGYDQNLGSLTKKWLTLHAAELWVETLVAQNTLATIGGRILVGPTTILTSDLADGAGDTTIYVKHNDLASGDRVYLEANGKVEFLAITSAPSGVGPYSYSVTRNLDGSGRDLWYAGDAVFNTGTTGDGFIDLYSVRGVNPATPEYGPTIVGNVRLSSTYNDWSPRWAIGNLDGLYGYSGTTYGVAFGNPSDVWMAMDATNGLRISEGGSVRAQWDTSGNILIGRTGTNQSNVYITADAVKLRTASTDKLVLDTSGTITTTGDIVVGTAGVIRSNATAWATGTGYWLEYNSGTPRFRIGTTSGNRLSWDGTDLTLVSGNVTISSSGIELPTGSWSTTRTYGFSDDSGMGFNTDNNALEFKSSADISWYTGDASIYMHLRGGTSDALICGGCSLGLTTQEWKHLWLTNDAHIAGDIYNNPYDDTSDFNPVVYDSGFGVYREKTNGISANGTTCTITAIQSGIVTGATCS